MRVPFYAVLFLLGCCFMSCGGAPNYTVTIVQPNMENKTLGEILDIHVIFDEMDEKTIENISITLKTVEEGLLLYDIPESLQMLNAGAHYEHETEFSLNVQPGVELILEATAFQTDAEESEKARASVTFTVN